MTCGGRISGNSASGSPDIAIRPPMTVTIAITIATIGLLIKNLDIICVICGYLVVGSHVRDGFHLHPRSDFHGAFGDYRFARPESIDDHPHRATALADFHRPQA